MKGLSQKVKEAEDIQFFWNRILNLAERKELYENNKPLVNIWFRRAGCENICPDCLCIWDTSIMESKCGQCGSITNSYYYC